jgi:hypothetical protein
LDERGELKFRIPISTVPPEEERISTGVVQTALIYKILQEAREAKASLEAAADRLQALVEAVTAKGEVLPLTKTVGESWVKVEPGLGMWRGVNIYNSGGSRCLVRLNRMDALPVPVEPNGSRSWSFLTECIKNLYVRCEKGETTVELEFLR